MAVGPGQVVLEHVLFYNSVKFNTFYTANFTPKFTSIERKKIKLLQKALDVRFNGARFNHCGTSFKNWYLRRRSQLLRESTLSPGDAEWYLTERKRILRAQYGKHPIGTANSQWSQGTRVFQFCTQYRSFIIS